MTQSTRMVIDGVGQIITTAAVYLSAFVTTLPELSPGRLFNSQNRRPRPVCRQFVVVDDYLLDFPSRRIKNNICGKSWTRRRRAGRNACSWLTLDVRRCFTKTSRKSSAVYARAIERIVYVLGSPFRFRTNKDTSSVYRRYRFVGKLACTFYGYSRNLRTSAYVKFASAGHFSRLPKKYPSESSSVIKRLVFDVEWITRFFRTTVFLFLLN